MMRWLGGVALGFAIVALPAAAEQPDVKQLVQRSVDAMDANWKAAPDYSYIERDVDTKHGVNKTIHTWHVYMIEGSTYNRLIAVNDQNLSKQEHAKEERKLRAEIKKRESESPSERERRIDRYRKERHQDHVMMREMVNAFAFTLVGKEQLNGREVWVLDATPKPGYQALNHEAKVLTGMKGRLWIDTQQYQWAKVSAEVVKPVTMFFVARVAPGTRFELEQEPITGSLWMPKRFVQTVKATALGFFDESSTESDSFRDYRPNPTLAMLISGEQ